MNPRKQLLGAVALVAASLTSASAQLIISEVHPTGSSASTTYAADWFEVSNLGAAAVDITGWKVDDSSPSFAAAVALRGVTSIAPGQSVIFLEGKADGSTDATIGAAFQSAWFGSSVPAGLTLGFYGGSGIGLSSGGDAVNLFNSSGTIVVGVTFGGATTGVTFDNTAGSSGAISQLSAVGINGAFNSVAGGEIGSPGIVVVPEPTALSLAGLGLAALIFRSRVVARR
jgi:hypothetical protein